MSSPRSSRLVVVVSVVGALVVVGLAALVMLGMAREDDSSDAIDVTAGLRWTEAQLPPTSVRQALHDGQQYLVAGVSEGDVRQFQLHRSADGKTWSTVNIDTEAAGAGLVPGTILGMNARDGMLVLRAEFFDPGTGANLGDSIPQRALVTVDEGANWLLSDPIAVVRPPVIEHVSYRKVLQKVVPFEGELYALAWASATVDARSLVSNELQPAAACVEDYNNCPPGLTWPDAREQLRNVDLPADLQRLLDNDLSWHVTHSSDQGLTWTPVDLPRASDDQLDMEADTLGVVISAGSRTTGDGEPVFWQLARDGSWESIQQPSVISHVEVMDDTGGVIVAWGIDAAESRVWVPTVRGPDGSWEQFASRPGDNPNALAIGPAGTIYENTNAPDVDVPEIVFRPTGGDWQAGSTLSKLGSQWRVRYVVGQTNLLGLQPIDRGLGPDTTYTDLVATMNPTMDHYLDLDRFQVGGVWLLEPTADR